MSSGTKLDMWPDKPIPATCPGPFGSAATTARTAAVVARHQSSGSCSTQPGRGVRNGCGDEDDPRMVPSRSTAITFVPDVPTSIPTKHVVGGLVDIRRWDR